MRLLEPDELPADWDPTTDPRLTAWEMVHHLIRALEAGGESAAAALVAKLGSKAEIARELGLPPLHPLRAQEARAGGALLQRARAELAGDHPPGARGAGSHAPRKAALFEQTRNKTMAITNHERVGKALELLKAGLAPFVEREFKSLYTGPGARRGAALSWANDRLDCANKPFAEPGTRRRCCKLMWDAWNDVFRQTLGQAERSLVSELRDVRNQWAHQEPFSGDDAYRALDSAERLLTAVSAPQADEIDKMKMELLRPSSTSRCAARSARAPAPPSRAQRRATSSPGARW